jgi:hypothetical protein
MGRRKPSTDESLHTLPLDASLLASPFKRVMPEVTDREAEVGQCVPESARPLSDGDPRLKRKVALSTHSKIANVEGNPAPGKLWGTGPIITGKASS